MSPSILLNPSPELLFLTDTYRVSRKVRPTQVSSARYIAHPSLYTRLASSSHAVRSITCVAAASTVLVDHPVLPLSGRFAQLLCSPVDFIAADVEPVTGHAIVFPTAMFAVVGPVARMCTLAPKLQAEFTFVVVHAFLPFWYGLGSSGAADHARCVAGGPIFGHTDCRVLRCTAAALSVYPQTSTLLPRVLPCPRVGFAD